MDPASVFADFYTNPTILALGQASRWTVSGQLGEITLTDENPALKKRKAPIDFRHLMDGCNPSCQHTGALRGAFATDATCLVTLDELSQALPTAANTALFLRSQIDQVVVIDIEPDCPPEIADELLCLPGVLYAEQSMSGRGYHLITAPPSNLLTFPDAATKRVLRDAAGHYELLFEHWITFTRQPISDTRMAQAQARTPTRFTSVESLYADLAQHAKPNYLLIDGFEIEAQRPEIAHAELIIESVLDNAAALLREPSDFDDDTSRWEFSVLGTLYNQLNRALARLLSVGARYDDSQVTWLLYETAQTVLPPRTKHYEQRNNRPYLLDRAASMVAQRRAASVHDTEMTS